MLELEGKYGSAKIFTDIVDEASVDQVKQLLDQPFVDCQKVRMMPDIHAGAGCTIGTTMTIDDKICPNLVGVDIGCGMFVVKLNRKPDFEELDRVIRTYVPSGFNIHEEANGGERVEEMLNDLYCAQHINMERALRSVGTLGGGNHFIEVDIDSAGEYWLVIHSGSRHLGVEIAKYYQAEAIKQRKNPKISDEIKETIEKLKELGRQREIPLFLEEMKDKNKCPDALCWLEGDLFNQYLHDMDIAQRYAEMNRQKMANIILEHLTNVDFGGETFSTIHNYIDIAQMILRKGAVSAIEGEKLIIPMNMRDGSLICVGKGNSEWNYSAPHGAGRLMSRGQARNNFSLEEFKLEMNGIWTTSVSESTIDEAPMVYKPMESIIENIKDTVEIIDVIKPVYNFKAGS